MLKKILIANRGEIAVRILRACREMGIGGVAVYSDADRASLHVRMADEAYRIGPAPSRESYLVVENVISAARQSGCDAIHPGYGFLAENPALARACVASGITFIGPSAEAMERLGSKTAARQLARAANVPTVPGTLEPLESVEAAHEAVKAIGFPIVLKAVAGGGGKGMRRVELESDLLSAWRDASSEALNAFGDSRLYLEKYLSRPRHIEIQILADTHGNTIYLGERECSVQRRYQKVIEEAPSPVMTPELRRAMGEAAVKLAKAGGYVNAGTCEFLVDEAKSFYFLEMNTRLQVEHPVTEMVTALDLVKLQIRVAAGEGLPLTQADVTLRGHAIECRIYAEDPENNFFPSPGTITDYSAPSGPGIRLDEGVYPGWTVPSDYDPMLAKLIAWGTDRNEAIARLIRALGETRVGGIRTNIDFFRRILTDEDFVRADIHTRWLDDFIERGKSAPQDEADPGAEDAATIALALWHSARNGGAPLASNGEGSDSRWKSEGRREQMERLARD
ncbi:MAG: acetyl-CoA carboxylase biotin carboxylase subunit [Candidatus Acidiferrales bacterium]|jgi:acetyl-CoA carboxylase biotin carboxylase subunit